MKDADLKKMGEILDEIRKMHADAREGIKIVHRQLGLINKQLQLMEDEYHWASKLSEPEN
jgi:hypothetical protein